MTEHTKAKAWREKHGLTLENLAELTGYSLSAIWWFEAGLVPPSRNKDPKNRKINQRVWHRYKMACAGVHATLRSKQEFKW